MLSAVLEAAGPDDLAGRRRRAQHELGAGVFGMHEVRRPDTQRQDPLPRIELGQGAGRLRAQPERDGQGQQGFVCRLPGLAERIGELRLDADAAGEA